MHVNVYPCICEHVYVCAMCMHVCLYLCVCVYHFLSQFREDSFTFFTPLLTCGLMPKPPHLPNRRLWSPALSFCKG